MAIELKASPQGPVRIFTTRSGRKVELVAVMPECRGVDASQERIIGVCPSRPGERNCRTLRTWKINGRFLAMGEHDLDLMDLPPGLQPTVPPTGQPSYDPLPRINRNCEEIIRQAQDVIARTRLLMLRQANGTESAERHHGHDLEGAAPEMAFQQPAQRSAVESWPPGGPLLTDEVDVLIKGIDARHQLLDEIVTPVVLVLEKLGRQGATESPIGWLEAAIVVRALREAGYAGGAKPTAKPPAK